MTPATDPFLADRQPAQAGQVVVDPAGWCSVDMAASRDWLYELSEAEVDAIIRVVRTFDADKIDLMKLSRADFDFGAFNHTLRDIRQQLAYGSGVTMLRGLPVERLGKRPTAIAFWGIGQHLGDDVLSQNKRGHLLGHVTNLGQSKSNPNQRGPYSKESIPFHVDCADVVGLLCAETALSGGDSRIVSAVTVHNRMLAEHPHLLKVLCEPYYRDRRDEIPAGLQPWYQLAVFHYHAGYFSASIEPTYMSSPHRFDDVPEMTAEQKEALRVVQQIADEESLDMGFRRGDMQFLNNHVIFHSRRGFEDNPSPDRKRHLLRIWLKQLDGRPLPDAFYLRHGTRATVDRPGGIVGADTVFSAPLERT